MLRRVLGAPHQQSGPYAGDATVLDGNTAVAVTEAAFSEAAALGASFPGDLADLAWRIEKQRRRVNLAGHPLADVTAEGPRGVLAGAMGLALSGTRATVFLAGTDLAACRDLLSAAAGRRLPLVLHLSNRAIGAQASALGTGHEAVHLAADSGCFVLFAANVQEAVDFSLIARQAAEQALTTGIVVMDGEQTALALQDVRLPPPALLEKFLGSPGEKIPAPEPAQQLLFGETRRRVPRWHNPDRPVLLGGVQPPQVWAAGRAAERAFFGNQLSPALDRAFEQFAELTGRRHQRVSAYRAEDARLILVTQGASIETAEAAVDFLRARHRIKAGVLGLRCLNPFPGAELCRLLDRATTVCVLERTDTPLAQDPPLLRELRVALERAAENARSGGRLHPDYKLSTSHARRFLSVLYGLGGLPLSGADLVALCRRLETLQRSQVYLGLSFSPTTSLYPKRQVLLDRLRRSYPDIADLGIREPEPSAELRPDGALCVAIHHLAGERESDALSAELAAFLHRILGGGTRCRPALPSDAWGEHCVDRVSAAGGALRDYGDSGPANLLLVIDDALLPRLERGPDLGAGSRLLVVSPLPEETLWRQLSSSARAALKDEDAELHRMALPEGGRASQREFVLGAACGLLARSGLLDISPRRLLANRAQALQQSVADVQPLLDAFESGLGAPQAIDTTTLARQPATDRASGDDEAPGLVRKLGSIDDGYDSLPRFWDQVGVLYQDGVSDELAPDPYLAVGAVPPLSAGFRDLSMLRQRLPALDPELCTGCGDCWAGCPDSAINALALSPARLIDAGIRRSGRDELRPVASKLAKRVADLCRNPATRMPTAGELLAQAYDTLEDKLPFAEERRQTMRAGLEKLRADLGCLPLAVTPPFFEEPESTSKGSGDLLALSVDPNACKGCGICVRVCQPGALQLLHQNTQHLDQARRVRDAWDGLPDTEITTIQRVEQHADVATSAALQLTRGAAMAVAGGDGSEPGSGTKLALRLALATLEARQAPGFARFRKQVEEARDSVTRLIRDTLAGALPADDLEALSRGLAGIDSRQAELSAFIGEAERAIDNAVDAARLRRLVDLARSLGDLAWRLAKGRQGLGRARVGLVLSSHGPSGWSVAFPHSPFAGPVACDATGDGALLAAGLLEGQLRQATEGFVLMRKARLELEKPADASRLWSDLEGLSWRELDAEERALCPSLLLAGDSGLLGGRGLSQLVRLLGLDLPIRILLLADLDLGLASPAGPHVSPAALSDPNLELGLLSLAHRGALVAQSSIGAPQHLSECLDAAIAANGPALLHVYAPSPARHGFRTELTLDRARAAVAGRVLPLFRYDPRAEGVFGSRITLQGNPAPREAWSTGSTAGAFTPAHWAVGESRFDHLFTPVAGDAPAPVPLVEFLGLTAREQRNKTPFIEKPENGAQMRRLCVDERLVQVCAERQQAWRVLQELAGAVTPFTEQVRREAEVQVQAAREAELAGQAQDYEAQIQALRRDMAEETRAALRERLMALSGYRRSGPPRPEQDS
ncbi:MAG: 4Fe-4S binding protein, partial [Gammaproteobacteria bacterium]|nr:4Fe-4S binding protein [Gammaproteobacteria bacterium]